MKRVTISTGFITNSSSVIHYFDRKLLEDPDVAAFVNAYELQDGLVGSDLWSRSNCSSCLVTWEQKELAHRTYCGDLFPYDWNPNGPTTIPVDDDDVLVVIYGDEYTTFASTLSHLLKAAEERMGVPGRGSDEFH